MLDRVTANIGTAPVPKSMVSESITEHMRRLIFYVFHDPSYSFVKCLQLHFGAKSAHKPPSSAYGGLCADK